MATKTTAHHVIQGSLRKLWRQRIAGAACVALLAFVVDPAAALAQTQYRTVPILPGAGPAGVSETDWVLVHEGLNLVYARDIPRVAVIDGATNTVVRHIDVGQVADSAAVDAVRNRLYLVHGIHRQVSVINTILENVIETLQFDFTPGRAAVDPVNEELYVVGGGNTLAILDARDGQRRILHRITLPSDVGFVDVDPVRRRVYVALMNIREVAVVNAKNGELLFTVPWPPVSVFDMAVNSRTGLLYMTTLNANSVIALDVSRPPPARKPPVVADVFLGEQTFSVDVDAQNNRVYVLEHQGPRPGTLWILNGDTHQVENTIQLSVDGSDDPDPAKNLCWDSHHMDANAVTGRVYASCPVGRTPLVAVIPVPN